MGIWKVQMVSPEMLQGMGRASSTRALRSPVTCIGKTPLFTFRAFPLMAVYIAVGLWKYGIYRWRALDLRW